MDPTLTIFQFSESLERGLSNIKYLPLAVLFPCVLYYQEFVGSLCTPGITIIKVGTSANFSEFVPANNKT